MTRCPSHFPLWPPKNLVLWLTPPLTTATAPESTHWQSILRDQSCIVPVETHLSEHGALEITRRSPTPKPAQTALFFLCVLLFHPLTDTTRASNAFLGSSTCFVHHTDHKRPPTLSWNLHRAFTRLYASITSIFIARGSMISPLPPTERDVRIVCHKTGHKPLTLKLSRLPSNRRALCPHPHFKVLR